jgi:hypothetical protein
MLHRLDFIGMPYMERLRATCVPPNPFYPEKPAHIPSTRFLIREKIESIFRPNDQHMATAVRLVDNPRAKELIESMVITRSSAVWICTALRRIGVDASTESIERYQHYYFNINLIDRDDLETLMLSRGEEETKDRDEQRLNYNYQRILKTTRRVQSARMAVTPLAGMMNLMRDGLMPSGVEVSRIAAATRTAAIVKTNDCLHQDTPERGRDFAYIAKMMSEVVQEVGDVEDDLQEGLTKLILKTDNQPTPHIRELTDGSHTLQLEPIEAEGETVENGESE